MELESSLAGLCCPAMCSPNYKQLQGSVEQESSLDGLCRQLLDDIQLGHSLHGCVLPHVCSPDCRPLQGSVDSESSLAGLCRQLLGIIRDTIGSLPQASGSPGSIKQGATAFQVLQAATDDEVRPINWPSQQIAGIAM